MSAFVVTHHDSTIRPNIQIRVELENGYFVRTYTAGGNWNGYSFFRLNGQRAAA